jgi:hypothetical protein
MRMRLSKRTDVFVGHGSVSGIRIRVDVVPEAFRHQVTLHLERPEVIVIPVELLDNGSANINVGIHNLLVYLQELLV